jgi:hypothetical protein
LSCLLLSLLLVIVGWSLIVDLLLVVSLVVGHCHCWLSVVGHGFLLLVVCCWSLSVVGHCWLSVVGRCWLSVVGLSALCFWLLLMSIIDRLLIVSCWLLIVVGHCGL